jgi:hypothetical protein
MGGVAVGFSHAAIMEYLWGDIGAVLDNWMEMPSSGIGWYWSPPSQTPSSPSPPGGYIDVGLTGEAAPSVPFVGDDTDQFSREVLAMLSSLSYAPGDGRVEAVSPQQSSHPGGSDGLRPSDASAPPEQKGTEFLATETTDDALPPEAARANIVDRAPSHDDSSEGGMVALPRETVIDEALAEAAAGEVDVDALLSVPVQMERVSGRFQAFEVLSGEEEFSPAASSAGPAKGNATQAPATDAAALPPETRSGTFDVDHMPADLAFVKLELSDGALQPASPAISESSDASGTADGSRTSADAEPPTAARVPREDEEEEPKTSSLAKATVAAIAVATVVRVAAARQDASRQPTIEERLDRAGRGASRGR